jgi:hypothetical protein
MKRETGKIHLTEQFPSLFAEKVGKTKDPERVASAINKFL